MLSIQPEQYLFTFTAVSMIIVGAAAFVSVLRAVERARLQHRRPLLVLSRRRRSLAHRLRHGHARMPGSRFVLML
jgi:hypothetical protein